MPKCKQCTINQVKFINFVDGYKDCCCTKCTNLYRYGVENTSQVLEIKNKFLKTFKERYGGIGAAGKLIAEKRNKTIKEKYNGNYQQSNLYKEKCKATNIEKYGAEHFMQTDFGKQKYLNSRDYNDPKFLAYCKSIYKERSKKMVKGKRDKHFKKLLNQFAGRWTPLFDKDEYLGIHFRNKYKFRCESCKTEFEISLFNFHRDGTLSCPTCKQTNKSVIQHDFAEKIRKLKSDLIVQEEKTNVLSGKKSLDIFLPEYDLAIEYNGNIWHTDKFKNDINYHFNRFNECLIKDIKYIAFWSDEYAKYQQYILNMISGLLNQNDNGKQQLKYSLCDFNKQYIFFSHIDKNDKFLKFESNDFVVILKVKNNIINDVYCSDWTMINQFEFVDLDKFDICIDNRFLSIFNQIFKRKNFVQNFCITFYKLTSYKRSLKLLERTTAFVDKIYSYGSSYSIGN